MVGGKLYMNGIFIGVFIGIGLFLVPTGTFYLGYKFGSRVKKPPDSQMTEEQKRKAKKLQEDFSKLMNYNVDTAYGRKE